MDANLGAVIAEQDAVLLGRRSHEQWAAFWPGIDIEPFATFINGVTKHVATSRPLDREWTGTTVVDGDLIGFVDELKLVTAPAIACSGRRLLEGLPAVQLQGVRSATSPTGHLLVDYRVIG